MQLNPLYEMARDLGVTDDPWLSKFIDVDLRDELARLVARRPEMGPPRDLVLSHLKDPARPLSVFGLRDACAKCFAWGIPTPAAVSMLGRLGTVVEIGAGTGYWSALATGAGATVHAFDDGSWNLPQAWHPVQNGGPDAAGAVDAQALLLCWPPYDDPMAHNAVRSFRGDVVVYVGEGYGGCTADDAFHDLLEAEWAADDSLPSVSWPGIRDRVEVYRRRVPYRAASTVVVGLGRFADLGDEGGEI